ncbi:uncharacterized protein LOC120667686 [Panicum virgatum]|uniref:uncharacterized protein LOC120667686 n=1 Tax=Panicum virgatum TaxID=38727 RepID=UPI0019D5ADAA|nr:uncharacterized protein LOC120667686 [Panicum virgatum]
MRFSAQPKLVLLLILLHCKAYISTRMNCKQWLSLMSGQVVHIIRNLLPKKFTKAVLDQKFWKDCAIVCQLSELIVRALRIVDSDERPAMGYLFGAFHAAREEIVKRFQRKKDLVKPFLEYMDARWDKHFDKNLHAAGFWFNPNNQYNTELRDKYSFTTSGVLDVIEKYAGKDVALRNALTKEMKMFRNEEGDFGRPTAKHDRQLMLADEWWQTYGCSAPNLQKLALRVLSQTCSASGCERSWSYFEHVHSKKRNRLEHQRLNDIVYVHCNLRLRQRCKLSTRNYDPIMFEGIATGNEAWIVEDNPPRLTSEGLEAFRTKLSDLNIQCSDIIVSYLELDLDLVEADAMDESDEIMDDQNLSHEDAYDYGGMAFDVGGEQPQDEWNPIDFY